MKPTVWMWLCLAVAGPLFAADASPPYLQNSPNTYQVGDFTVDGKKQPAGKIEPIDDPEHPAVKISFVENASGGFMTSRLRPSPEWDKADGFSFWVKGDGSDHWGGLELIDRDDFGLRYGYCFPINSNQWQKISVRWTDLSPELAGPAVGNGDDHFNPSHFGYFQIGKWFYWRDYPAESFQITAPVLEGHIAAAPSPTTPPDPSLKRLKAKLAAHEPVTIVTMGDSLSDKHHWSNHDTLWSELLVKALHDRFGSEVKVVNPAIGGTTLGQNLVLMPRWLKQAPQPDLVIVWFGGNDWDSGVRGPRFKQALHLAVERIRSASNGAADILLLTTNPSFEKWQTMTELEQAVRDVAKEDQTALVDIAAEFHEAGSNAEAMKRDYWAWDRVHLGATGHQLVRDSILRLVDVSK